MRHASWVALGLVVTVLLGLGCGDGDGGVSTPQDLLTGTWEGTVTVDGESGTFTLILEQNGTSVTGRFIVEDPSDPLDATIENGRLTDNTFSFRVVSEFDGTVPRTVVDFTGTLSGDRLSGDLTITESGVVTASGTWTATKQ
ncbi:MAG: hypothetical protein ACE5JO_10020 [Candidatus Binatia bacterium]